MLTHQIDGAGDPLILLNGGLMSIAGWDPFIPRLKERFRIIRCDFRGQLLTPGPYPLTVAEHAHDVIDLLDHLGLERITVAGASFGAEVAMVVAATAPKRVAKLIVMTATERTTEAMRDDARLLRATAEAAAAGGDGGAVFRHMVPTTFSASWLAAQDSDFVEQRARRFARLPREYFAGLAALVGTLECLDLTKLLPSITAPSLVIGAERDLVFPIEHSRAIAAAIPNARFEIVRDSGHATIVERIDELIALLLAF